jgi:tetrahydromethanopterin S-methyltransferase subunit D
MYWVHSISCAPGCIGDTIDMYTQKHGQKCLYYGTEGVVVVCVCFVSFKVFMCLGFFY